MRKLVSLAGAGAMLLTFAGSTFAGGFPSWIFSDEATIKNYAHVDTDVKTKLNTGFNSVHSWFKGGTITTGAAESGVEVANMVNGNEIGCNCYGDLYVKNVAHVDTDVKTKVNTGYNTIHGGFFSGGSITSGRAEGISVVSNIVNTNVVGD